MSASKESTSPFSIPEIVSCVAKNLDHKTLATAALVNRSFYNACIPVLWKSICIETDFYTEESLLDHQGFQEGWVRNGIHIRRLTISNTDVDVSIALQIRDHCPHLQDLSLDDTYTSIDALAIILPYNPYETLPSNSAHSDSDASLESRKKRFQEDVLSTKDHRLVSLRLSLPLDRSAEKSLPKLSKSGPPQFPFFIKHISIGRSGGPSREVLSILARLGPQLEKLNLTTLSGVTDKEMFALLKLCPNLSMICLEGRQVTDQLLSKLTEISPRLKTLVLIDTSVTDKGLAPLYRSSLHFKEICLMGGPPKKISSESLVALVEKKAASDDEDGFVTMVLPPPPGLLSTPALAANTTLNRINLKGVNGLGDKGFLALLTFATVLEDLTLDGLKVKDEAILALASTSRNRMVDLGFPLPNAWIQHEEAENRLSSKSNKATAHADQTRPPPKYRGLTPGGLRRLSLEGCPLVTNKGIREIVRSCPNLELLHIGKCPQTSLQVFQGPWASRKLELLNIQDMNFVIGIKKTPEAVIVEEIREMQRFPLPVELYHEEEELGKDGEYDSITTPKPKGSVWIWGDDQYLAPTEARKPKFPRSGRNTAGQKALLRQFYEKLATMDRLISLNMNGVDFRVRVRDGLDQATPALQKSLQGWQLFQKPFLFLDLKDLLWIGKHFGDGSLPKGFTLNGEEEEEEDEVKKEEDEEVGSEVKKVKEEEEEEKEKKKEKRAALSKLRVLTLNEGMMEMDIPYEAYEWFMEAIPDVCLDKGFDHGYGY